MSSSPTMQDDSYYREHWVEIEPDRLDAYEEMFRWRPEMEPLIAPAELAPGLEVVDYGCGPGHLSVELAGRVGAAGHVHGVDLNSSFLERARRRAGESGLEERTTFHRIEADRIPLEDGSVDRVVCKNVLEYVDEPAASLADFRRVLRPGGLAHVIDSDWQMLVVEPIAPERLAELVTAAAPAFKTPLIGRKLYGLMRSAGFQKVKVRVLAGPDVRGRAAPVLFNMASYARASGRMEPASIDGLVRDVERAIEERSYLLVLPQFLVTGMA